MIAPAALARMRLTVLFRRPRLLDAVENEAGAEQGVDVLRERAIEARHRELVEVLRRVGEAPVLDPTRRIEIVPDHPLDLDALLVTHPVRTLGEKAGVHDAEREHPVRAKHAKGLAHRKIEAWTVHQRHERDDRVEA